MNIEEMKQHEWSISWSGWKEASYERFGNDGMGGELVINLDDTESGGRNRGRWCRG